MHFLPPKTRFSVLFERILATLLAGMVISLLVNQDLTPMLCYDRLQCYSTIPNKQTIIFTIIFPGNYCGVWIPEEADIKDNHASIQWDEVSKSFRLANGKSASADVTITSVPSSDESHLKSLQENGGFPLLNQLKFKTGLIEWTVSPVPRRKLVVSRLFDSLRQNNITELQEQWLYAESWNNYLKKLHIDRSTRMLYIIDSNAEEDPDYRIIDEQAKKSPKFSEEVTDAPSMYDGNSGSAGKFCLLHIAVDNLFLEGALFLLEKGAEVSNLANDVQYIAVCVYHCM